MARYKIINDTPINGDYWFYQPIMNANGTWQTDPETGKILVKQMVVRSIEKEKLDQVLALLNGSNTLTFAELEDLLAQMTNLRDTLVSHSYIKTQTEIENAIAATGATFTNDVQDQLGQYIKVMDTKTITLTNSLNELSTQVANSATSTTEALKNSAFPLGKDYRFDPNRGYLAGEVCFHNNKIYQCTQTYSKGTADVTPDLANSAYWKEFALASGSVYTKEDIDKFVKTLNGAIQAVSDDLATKYNELNNKLVDKDSTQTIPGKKTFNAIECTSIKIGSYTLTIA